MNELPRRAEVWWCELPHIGSRPVVTVSRDQAIVGLRRVMIAPCTTNVRGLPSEVLLEPGADPVPLRCVANLDSVESVSVASLTERIGALDITKRIELCRAIHVATGCD